MFALTKQQKIKKLLIKSKIDYTNLLEAHTKSLESTDQFAELRTEKLTIEIKKLCFAYDELKLKYDDFNSVNADGDHWKIDKPVDSEGMVFFTKSEAIASNYFPVTLSYDKFTLYCHENSPEDFFNNASPIVARARKHVLEEEALDFVRTKLGYSSRDTNLMLKYFLLYKELQELNANTVVLYRDKSTSLSADLQTAIAKLTRTNIICL